MFFIGIAFLMVFVHCLLDTDYFIILQLFMVDFLNCLLIFLASMRIGLCTLYD